MSHETVTQARVTASCHCGATQLSFPTPDKPLNECQCTICRRYGVLWAYYPLELVHIKGQPTETYIRQGGKVEFHRCKTCGCVTHWMHTYKTYSRLGVNCQMLEREVLELLEREKNDC
jgi:hypothetical protein